MLTARQEKFAQLISEGKAQAEAYRQVYDVSGMKDATVWTEASKLVRHPQVAPRVEVLRA